MQRMENRIKQAELLARHQLSHCMACISCWYNAPCGKGTERDFLSVAWPHNWRSRPWAPMQAALRGSSLLRQARTARMRRGKTCRQPGVRERGPGRRGRVQELPRKVPRCKSRPVCHSIHPAHISGNLGRNHWSCLDGVPPVNARRIKRSCKDSAPRLGSSHRLGGLMLKAVLIAGGLHCQCVGHCRGRSWFCTGPRSATDGGWAGFPRSCGAAQRPGISFQPGTACNAHI